MENMQDLQLTPAQRRLLEHLEQRRARGLAPASLEALCSELGLASRGSLHKQVAALVERGLVEPMEGRQRGVRLRYPESKGADGCELPLLGRIAAGRPIEALASSERIAVPPQMLPRGEAYALQVRGDSMQEAGILDGDIVLVESRQDARDGDIVVALIDGAEATLKRLRRRGPMVELLPENPEHPVQHYPAERVQVQGVLAGLLRRYR